MDFCEEGLNERAIVDQKFLNANVQPTVTVGPLGAPNGDGNDASCRDGGAAVPRDWAALSLRAHAPCCPTQVSHS